MKSVTNRLNMGYIAFVLGLLALVKLWWFMTEMRWLYFSDTDYVVHSTPKALHYTSRFASSVPPPAPKPKKPSVPKTKLTAFTLLSVFHSEANDVVTLRYKGKTEVLARGEKLGGFTFVEAGLNYAVFERDGKRYNLLLKDSKKALTVPKSSKEKETKKAEEKNDESTAEEDVIFDGQKRIISRELLTKYTSNLQDIYKNIGLSEVRKGKKIEGFKVNFIRRGSIFSKLGLQRGDILMEINGQPLDSYKAAFDAYRSINEETSATLRIKRGKTTTELRYEID
jgi:general secretion pathway protein C